MASVDAPEFIRVWLISRTKFESAQKGAPEFIQRWSGWGVKSTLYEMAAIKRIPVSPEILEELSRLKKPEQTFGELIAGMIEREKKFRLLKDMKRIEETAEFVEI